MEGKMISEVGRGFAAVWASLWCNFQFSRPKPLTPQRRLRTQRRMKTGGWGIRTPLFPFCFAAQSAYRAG